MKCQLIVVDTAYQTTPYPKLPFSIRKWQRQPHNLYTQLSDCECWHWDAKVLFVQHNVKSRVTQLPAVVDFLFSFFFFLFSCFCFAEIFFKIYDNLMKFFFIQFIFNWQTRCMKKYPGEHCHIMSLVSCQKRSKEEGFCLVMNLNSSFPLFCKTQWKVPFFTFIFCFCPSQTIIIIIKGKRERKRERERSYWHH